MDVLSRLRAAELLAGKMEKNKFLLFGSFSVLYFASTSLLAARKLMWNDELYTYYIARLPTMSDVWAALMAGGEQTPPFFYFLTRTSFALFGINNFALRFPEVIGFWMMSLCLFVFVARRASNFYGLIAALLPLLTDAYYYADEARPYGLVLGFGALALLCWQSATLHRFTHLSVAGLALSLAAAISCHYYAVLIILPLALGEVVRTFGGRQRFRIDFGIWAAFALALMPLVWHLPLIKRAKEYSGAFWSPPQWVNIPDFFTHQLRPLVLLLAVVLCLAACYKSLVRDDAEVRNRAESFAAPPLHEIAAVTGFALIPVINVILAKVFTGAFTDRYALPAVIGFGVLAAYLAAKLFDHRALMGAILVVCFSGWFLFTEVRAVIDPGSKWADPITAGLPSSIKLLRSGPEQNLPIVAADPHTMVVFSHYAPPEIASRLVYLADPAIALKRLGHNSVERGMVDLIKPWFGMNVVDYESFIAEHPRFLVYGNFGADGFLNWILPELEDKKLHVDFLGRNADNLYFLVSHDEQKEASRSASIDTKENQPSIKQPK